MRFNIKTSGGVDYRCYEWTAYVGYRHIGVRVSQNGVQIYGDGTLTLHEVEALADVLKHAREVASSPAMFDSNIAQFQVDSEAEYPRP
jgi:hypothetical protein